jgi:uncharacterized cupin superfamily protein
MASSSGYAAAVVPGAPLEETDAGLAAAGPGWFVLNARDARWSYREGRGAVLPFTGRWEEGDIADFPQVGVNLFVLPPGEPMSVYHGEDAQEDFLVLSGRCVLVVEGQERRLEAWDFVHCPPWTEHTIVGAGDVPCVVLAVGSRGADDIRFPANAAALEHGASVERDTTDGSEAYARFPDGREARYRDGLLP